MSAKVFLRDESRTRVAELDDYQSLHVTLKHGDVGSWQIEMPATVPAARYIAEASGVVIEHDGEVRLTGPVGLIAPSYKEGERTLLIAGPDDSFWLNARRCEPSRPPYTDEAYDAQRGLAETVMKHYVDANAGPGALAERQVPGLVIARDRLRGKQTAIQTRFDMLLPVLKGLAVANGDMGFGIRHEVPGYDPRQLVFDVYDPPDKTASVTFAVELGNISEFEYENNLPVANHIIVAGGGQGTARVFDIGEDDESIGVWGRIEGPLVDRRDTSDLDQLDATLDEELGKAAAQTAVSAKATNTSQVQYGRDWNLGNRVSLVLDGEPFANVIQEIDFAWEQDKAEQIYPVIGSAGKERPRIPKLFSAQRNLTKRLSLIESRT